MYYICIIYINVYIIYIYILYIIYIVFVLLHILLYKYNGILFSLEREILSFSAMGMKLEEIILVQ